MKSLSQFIFITTIAAILSGCAANHKPMKAIDHVDLNRFMGDWYVIANIPTFIEKQAHNAIETYRLNADGTIATTFRFNHGAFDGKVKTYHPKGFVTDTQSNAIWGMQFIWPFKADYRIVYLDENYQTTIIGRSARDYVWLMAREPSIPEAQLEQLLQRIESLGYDLNKVERVPQQLKAAAES